MLLQRIVTLSRPVGMVTRYSAALARPSKTPRTWWKPGSTEPLAAQPSGETRQAPTKSPTMV